MNKNTFQSMIQDILDNGRRRLSYHVNASQRIEVLTEMKNELVAMKETYEAIYGKIDITVFNEAMKIS